MERKETVKQRGSTLTEEIKAKRSVGRIKTKREAQR